MRGEQPWRTNRSRVLRSQPISAEAKLWHKLRNRQLAGLKFVRQASIDPYFVDFLCREHKVVVEIDGGTHSTHAELAADTNRGQELERMGYRVFRAHNADVFEDIDGVLDTLLAFIEERTS
jgi:very-short-patch-repair endonuclease